MAGLLGAYLVQVEQAARKLIMSALRLGQYKEVAALSNMEVALAWPAWRCSNMFCCKDLGITGRSWSITTGPTVTSE